MIEENKELLNDGICVVKGLND